MSQTKSLLLVEDDSDLRLTLEYFLRKIGWGVVVANSGEEAVATWRQVRPRVVLLDIKLPLMSGYDVCENIKREALDDELTVIFISARPEHEIIAGGNRAGADYYIRKPVDPVDVGSDLYFLFDKDFNMTSAELSKLRVVRAIPKFSSKASPEETQPVRKSVMEPKAPPPTRVSPPPVQYGATSNHSSYRSAGSNHNAHVSASRNGVGVTDTISQTIELLGTLQKSLREKPLHILDEDQVRELLYETDHRIDAIIEILEMSQEAYR